MQYTEPYELGRIAAIYAAARNRGEPTIAFEMRQGNGRFVFLIFFSDQDEESKDTLYLFLRRTNVVLTLKMYGDHWGGTTRVFLTEAKKRLILAELAIWSGGKPFDWASFFAQVNAAIPQTLPLQETLEKVREVWPDVKKDVASGLDECEKTVLIGIKRLPPNQRPRDRTLCKLYVYTDGNAADIAHLIDALRRANITLLWSSPENGEGKSFADIFVELN
jgi:hypothetical protein